MDIRILRDGIEIGPFSEETVQTLLQQGSIGITDMAWRPGLPQWVPLANLLYATATPPPPPGSVPPPPPPPPPPSGAAPAPQAAEPVPADLPKVTHEPATPKQKAFLSYMAVPFAPEIDRENASHLVNEAMENPRNAARLAKWNKDRLKLHPELFAEEIQAAKEQRAQHYFEICETQGAPYFSKVTKAHCQVLVGYLDVHHPHWEADEREAVTSYFFPAIAEKFPQLLHKEAKGKFKYPEGPKVARELAQRSPVVVKARRTSPAAALGRGVFFGVLILAMLWFVKSVLEKSGKEDAKKLADVATPMPAEAPAPAPADAPPADVPPALPPPADIPPAVDPGAAAAPGEMAANPPPAAPADGMAALPPLNPDPIMAEADPAAAQTPQPAPPAPPGTPLVLTKPVEIQAKFGKIKLPPGTPLKLIQQNGQTLTVQVAGRDVATVPASSTSLGAADGVGVGAPGLPPPAVPPPIMPAAPAPAPAMPVTPAAPAAPADSLFGPPPTPAPGTARTNPASDL